MRRALSLHPDYRHSAATYIAVEIVRPRPHVLELRYLLTGRIGQLVLPPPAASERTDELWRNTCFEAFLRAPDGGAYYELNFSPSTQWAAYRLAGYRSGMSDLIGIAAPSIKVRLDAEELELQVQLDLHSLRDLPGDGPWRLGLSAVIQEPGGSLSHWALAHPPGKADFHHADCFALEVLAPRAP